MLRNTLLAILLAACATTQAAEPPDYVFDGIYPGMPSDKAKEAGYTACESLKDTSAITCSRPAAAKPIAGVPVKYIYAVFKKPYAAVDEVRIGFNADKPCKKGKGAWADVKGPECFYDVDASLSKVYGKPIGGSRHGSVWHKCGSYAMRLERDALSVTVDPAWAESRKQECASRIEQARAQDASNKAASDFMQKMK